MSDIKALRRLYGSGGQRDAAFEMMEQIRSARPSFNPEGLDEHIKSKDTKGTEEARLLMPNIQLTIRELTLILLKTTFGEYADAWWRKGVPVTMRQEVVARREQSPEGGEREDFFDLIDYKKIADKHWKEFQKFFSFGSSRRKGQQLAWFDKLNGIRNRIAHPERGPIKEEELEFLGQVQTHLKEAMQSAPSVDSTASPPP